jgi:hypothetical protein
MSRGDSWIFRRACGCAFGLVDVNARADTLSKAWKAMYPTVRERDAALDRGVTVTREAWEDYNAAGVYGQLGGKTPCPHNAEVAS